MDFATDPDTDEAVRSLFEQESDDRHVPTEEENAAYGRDMKRLQWANLLAGVFHVISFFAALTLSLVFSDRIYRATVTRTFTEWNGAAGVPTLRTLGTYPLSWTVLPFPVLTAAAHLVILSPCVFRHYARIVLHHGKCDRTGWNWIRWTEYAITASLMTWTIAQLSGVTDLALLFVLVALNVAMQLFGGLGHELLNFGWRRRGTADVRWWAFGLGFVPFAAVWTVIFAAFIVQAVDAAPPTFVWIIIFGMFAFFASFVVPILLHYTRWQNWLAATNADYELAFIALSFVSKAALDWTLVIGSITR